MTREELVESLNTLKDQALKSHNDTAILDVRVENFVWVINETINALEQEPFMNKPCVAHQVCHEYKVKVIDKITAEIDQKQYDFMPDGDYNEGIRFGLMLAYQIIDKYKAESEEQE